MQSMSYTGPLAGLLNFVAGARKANKTPHEQKPTVNTRGEQMAALFKTIYSKASTELVDLDEPMPLRYLFEDQQIVSVLSFGVLVTTYMAVPWFHEGVQARMTVSYLEGRRLVVELTKEGVVNIYDRYEAMMMQDDSMTAEYAGWFCMHEDLIKSVSEADQAQAN